jgi:plasmid replication initiation protein
MKDLDTERNRLVVKDNQLVRKARYNLTSNQQKILAYLISKIKPTDTELARYDISIKDFCELCGIEKDYFYTEIREIVDNLDNKAFWVETEEKIFKFRWFSEVEIIKGSGIVSVQLNSNIKKYLLELSENFTQYELCNILALKSKYSIRLYEWFKSYSFMHEKRIEIDSLKYILEADNYKNFKDFRVRVIEKAIKEINEYTDLEVSYETVNQGKKVIAIIFYIRVKQPLQRYNSYINTLEVINRSTGQIKGQRSLFDKGEEDFNE